jgi:hypothetical protein
MIFSSTLVFSDSIHSSSPNGEARMGVVYLFQKTEPTEGGPWPIVQGGAWGMMRYTLWGETFNFHFKGRKLQPGVSYTLIYYPDPWPGNNLICLGSGVANEDGNIRIADHNFDIQTSLPAPDVDANFAPVYPSGAVGAKIWLVLSSDVDCEGDEQVEPPIDPQMTGWNPDQYLFEYNLINFEYQGQVQH